MCIEKHTLLSIIKLICTNKLSIVVSAGYPPVLDKVINRTCATIRAGHFMGHFCAFCFALHLPEFFAEYAFLRGERKMTICTKMLKLQTGVTILDFIHFLKASQVPKKIC